MAEKVTYGDLKKTNEDLIIRLKAMADGVEEMNLKIIRVQQDLIASKQENEQLNELILKLRNAMQDLGDDMNKQVTEATRHVTVLTERLRCAGMDFEVD